MSYTVAATGDLIMNGSLLGGSPRSDAVFAQLRDADHSFVNLEMPLTTSTEESDKPICLKAPPSLAAELRAFGIDVVTLANNHAMDFGAAGLFETTDALAAANIQAVGAGCDLADSLRAVQVRKDGLRVAYLGVATTLPNGSNAGRKRPGVAPIRVMTSYAIDAVSIQETPGMAPFAETAAFAADVDLVLSTVRAAAAENDIVIVAIHWGVPFGWVAASQDEIAQYQRPLGRALIDAGASAVIGHHPHVLQGVEFHNGRPIFYSLGNFVMHNVLAGESGGLLREEPKYSLSSLMSGLTRLGGIARLTWTDPRQPPKCTLIPVHLNADGEPELADRAAATEAFERVLRGSRKLGAAAELIFIDGRAEVVLTVAEG